jgi:hypothetical protein
MDSRTCCYQGSGNVNIPGIGCQEERSFLPAISQIDITPSFYNDIDQDVCFFSSSFIFSLRSNVMQQAIFVAIKAVGLVLELVFLE